MQKDRIIRGIDMLQENSRSESGFPLRVAHYYEPEMRDLAAYAASLSLEIIPAVAEAVHAFVVTLENGRNIGDFRKRILAENKILKG